MNLYQIFKIARESQNIRQSYLAEVTGVARTAISQYEAGVPAIRSENIKKILPHICMNPDFIEDNTVSPFKSVELIQMELPRTFFVETSIFRVLIQYSHTLEFISLVPSMNRATLADLTFAILIKDDIGNIFLLKPKKPHSSLHDRQSLENILKPVITLAGKNSNNFVFRFDEIDSDLYLKIKNSDTLTINDLSPVLSEQVLIEKLAELLTRGVSHASQFEKVIHLAREKLLAQT